MTQQGDLFLSYVDKEMQHVLLKVTFSNNDWLEKGGITCQYAFDTRGCSITITYFPPKFIFSSATVQYGSFCLRSLERLYIAVNIFIVESA